VKIRNRIGLHTEVKKLFAKKLVHKYKLHSFFGVKSMAKINYCNATFISSASAKV